MATLTIVIDLDADSLAPDSVAKGLAVNEAVRLASAAASRAASGMFEYVAQPDRGVVHDVNDEPVCKWEVTP